LIPGSFLNADVGQLRMPINSLWGLQSMRTPILLILEEGTINTLDREVLTTSKGQHYIRPDDCLRNWGKSSIRMPPQAT